MVIVSRENHTIVFIPNLADAGDAGDSRHSVTLLLPRALRNISVAIQKHRPAQSVTFANPRFRLSPGGIGHRQAAEGAKRRQPISSLRRFAPSRHPLHPLSESFAPPIPSLRGRLKSRLPRKTGVLACQGRQASGQSEQPGTAVGRDSRDGCLPVGATFWTPSKTMGVRRCFQPFTSPTPPPAGL